MILKPGMRKILTFAFASAALLAAGGCTQNQINPADNAQTSVSTVEIMPGRSIKHTTVEASALQPGNWYKVKGQLTINGNLPDNTKIQTEGGPLVVNGNVGKADLRAFSIPVQYKETQVPAVCDSRNFLTTMIDNHSLSHGNAWDRMMATSHIKSSIVPCTKTVNVPEPVSPGIIINGTTSKDTKTFAHAGVSINQPVQTPSPAAAAAAARTLQL